MGIIVRNEPIIADKRLDDSNAFAIFSTFCNPYTTPYKNTPTVEFAKIFLVVIFFKSLSKFVFITY